MAGESPDRSNQRESSEEPTSGSAGPVPEARSEAREARDPRLSLTGESGTTETRGGVDTATRVLSVRDLVTDAEEKSAEAETEEAETEETETEDAETDEAEAEQTGSEPEGDDPADATGDARLRAAVAAWVDSAGAKKGEKAESAEDQPAADEEAEAEGGDDAEGSDGSVDDGEAEPGAEGKKEDTEARPEGKSDGKPEAGTVTDADTDAEVEGKPPVDRPTAVFKAPKPPVDQPTTMLKLGGAAKNGGKKPAPESGESDVERTSKFVALKPLDAPETRKPQPGTSQPQPKPQPQPRPGTSQPQPQPKPTAAAPAPVAQAGPERTTQQPLPPKPPLDLLAELTNTPPPPETPLRTTVRRVKIWTPLVVLLAIVFAIVQAVRPLPAPTLALTAKDTYTFDGGKLSLPWPSEGQGWMDVEGVGTMDHFGKQTPVAIGSVAKTMTSYIILRDHPLKPGQEGPKIEVDQTAEKEGGYDKSGGESTLNTVKAGDFLTEKQALSAVMIPSANNIARLLARWDAGSEAAFVKKMNDTAKELGMTGTTYTDPSGLTKTTVSTAEDQVKLGNVVVKIPALIAITSAASWTDPSGHNWPNYNTLPYTMGAIGIKTGTTTAAGGNLLFAARKKVGGQTVTVVGAILGQHKPSILDTVNTVSKTALRAARDALTSAKLLKKGDVVGYVDDQLGGRTPVVVTEDVSAVGWSGSEVKLSFTADELPHSAKAGTKVGTLTVGDGGSDGAVRVPVALQKDLAEPAFTDKLTRLG